MSTIEIYDTTLRDGAQRSGISFSLHDKLAILRRLDLLGAHYVELGWPGANEKDSQVFRAAKKMKLQTAKVVAFGMTCSKGKKPEDDQQLLALLGAETEVIAIVGKSSRLQVRNVLGVTMEENLHLIEESCRFLTGHGRMVIFDAEHYFDGYKQDSSYSSDCLSAAIAGGALRVVLCDTNGGSLPSDIASIITATKGKIVSPIGIHAHNDCAMAVANTLSAVQAGADHVQVTINGYGERCGNADIFPILAALQLKMGYDCIPPENMVRLTDVARFTAEVANLPVDPYQPIVGKFAFRHKGGLHANAVSKDPNSYNHIDPVTVGNIASVAVSELSGRSNVMMKASEFGIILAPEQAKKILACVEGLENRGLQFEGADGSLKLVMMRQLEGYAHPFEIVSRDVMSRRRGQEEPVDSATVKILINDGRNDLVHHVADGDGPIDALANAILKALLPYFPVLKKTRLVDHKSRVLSGKKGTAKAVRILIDFSDGHEEWTTVGCSTDSIEANLQALADGFEYAILKAR